MRHGDVYAVASKDIVFESFDGEAVVLDLSTGKYFGFSDSGSGVWQALSSGVGVQAIVEASAIEAADLEEFISRLLEFGLLIPANVAGQSLPGDIAAALSAAREPLGVDVHDDLADLIVVDPIHEVEEPRGWPAVKQAN